MVNRGDYLGTSYFKKETGLGGDDKRELIGFLKMFQPSRPAGSQMLGPPWEGTV